MKRFFYVYRCWYKRLIVYLFDTVGRLLFLPLKYFSHRRPNFQQMTRILVIRLDHLGDAVMTWPAIRALERMFPAAAIDLLVSQETAPLFRDSFHAGEVLAVRNHWFGKSIKGWDQLKEALSLAALLRKKRYELAIDFRGDLRNITLMFLAGIPLRLGFGITGGGFLLTHQGSYDHDKHRVELCAELLRFCAQPFELKPEPFSHSEERKEEFWSRWGGVLADNRRCLLIHPSASCASKQWPLERFRELIENILKRNLGEIILIGTEQEKEVFPIPEGEKLVDMRGKTTLGDLPILMDQCELFIGNDSGPAHIAAAQGKYVISIFSGTNRREAWHPWTTRLRVVEHAVACSPCEARICPLGHHDCMEKITVEEVLRVLSSVLDELSQARKGIPL